MLILELDGSERSASRPSRFVQEKRSMFTLTKRMVVLQSLSERFREKNCCPFLQSNLEPSVTLSVACQYAEYVIVAPGYEIIICQIFIAREVSRKLICVLRKRKQLDLKLRNLYWIIGRKSQLSLENKLLVYKVILKPIWTYGIQI